MTMGVVRTTRRPRSLHQSGGGDAFDDILAPGDVSVPPSWRSPRAARSASRCPLIRAKFSLLALDQLEQF